MTRNKDTDKTEKPKINVVDRRHWAYEDEDANGEESSEKDIEEKLPT